MSAISMPVAPASAKQMEPSGAARTTSRDLAALVAISPETRASIRILVADDEHTLRESCANVLRLEGYKVTVTGRGQDALDLLKRGGFDVVLADLFMSQVDGLTLLRAALAAHAGTLVVVMTGNPSVESSIEALRQGAWDYLPKPFSAGHLQILIGRAAHAVLVARESAEQAAPGRQGGPPLIGVSAAFQRAVELARRVAATDASVFVTGESGSGKEMIAQVIHQHSRRASRSFVALNCAALPEPLLESEMFGHRKGAFTGAVRDKPGLLETANGGTLFLDELIDMPKSIQAKLLRVIQDGVVRRVGSEATDALVNVRFISATNGDPDAAIKVGALREDLFYRLRVVPIHLPPLRERPEDIPLLAEHFLTSAWARHRRWDEPRPRLTDAAERALTSHAWRGNVRELQNVIEHMAVLADPGRDIQPGDLPLAGENGTSAAELATPTFTPMLHDEAYHEARDRVIRQFERQYLTALVARAAGNMSKAARLARVDRTTLYRLMERHGLQRNVGGSWLIERPAGAGEFTALEAVS